MIGQCIARRAARFALLLAALCAGTSTAQAQVVISQVYGGGGNTGAPLNADFVELFNRGATATSITGWSIQYASATGSTWTVLTLPAATIPVGGYYLVKVSSTGPNGAPLPTPDFDSTLISAAAANGKFALVSNNTALSGTCPSGGPIVDFVGYGSANCSESSPTPALSNTTAALRNGNGCTDTNNNSLDFTVAAPAPRNSSTPSAPCGGPSLPALSINDVAVTEGNSGTTTATFTVSLSSPAGPGGVSFNIATADGTATVADNDYVTNSQSGQTIAAGNTTYSFSVTINGDTTPEPNETYFVNVTNVTGATVDDGQGLGTIVNDDATITPISSVQGAGATSPLVGQTVTVRGIVTSRVNNGFYVQSQPSDEDGNAATSEALFVFTSSAPTTAATVGNLVQITGTVAEFIPPSDPNQQPLTQLTGPSLVVLSTGNALPAPIDLTTTLPAASGNVTQLELLENMRVRVPTLNVVAPTGGAINETNATSTTNGRFHGVVVGNARPFREPGLEVEDAATQPPTIPRWDNNPEKLNIESTRARDSSNVARASIDVDEGATIANVVGVLDYAFRNHRITLDFDATPPITGGRTPAAVATPTDGEFTVATYNLQRFFDDQDDPGITEPVLTPTAYQNRLNKASNGIRNFLRTPDIIGVVEVENLTVLQQLAARINADAVAAGQPNPQYVARLIEGNDAGGIDVGFLFKTASVPGGPARVTEVGTVQQLGAGELLRCPDNTPIGDQILNDRPSLRLDAVVASGSGASTPITVIVNHLRSLIGINSNAAASGSSACFGTEGNRVRHKRQQQATFLAQTVQALQTADPNRRILLIGDFNAFEFNDGFVHSIGVITGDPAPDAQTVIPGDGIDLVEPNLVTVGTLPSTPPSERYSFVFSGNAQTLDHALANAALVNFATAIRVEHARINADFGEDNRPDPTIPIRLSDHDPVVTFIGAPGFGPPPNQIFSNGFEPLAPPSAD